MSRRTVAQKRRTARLKAMQKQRKKKTGVGVLLFCILLVSGFMVYQRFELEEQRNTYARQKIKLEEEKESLEAEAGKIEEHKAYVQTKSYVEEVAREKLGLVYPDEVIFEAEE